MLIYKKYFVAAKCKSETKSGKVQEHYHNGIITIWFWQRKNSNLLNKLTVMFANNIAAQNKDLKIKEFTITSFARL